MVAKLRAKQKETLEFFSAVGDEGATIPDLKYHFQITHPSARSRVMYLKEKKLLKVKREKTEKNTPLLRFFLTAKAKRLFADAA